MQEDVELAQSPRISQARGLESIGGNRLEHPSRGAGENGGNAVVSLPDTPRCFAGQEPKVNAVL
jgi:hypothetical protein